jgi:hypothetical protein
MKYFRLSFLGVLILFLSQVSHAADVTLTWSAPTANSDGSTPPVIGGYNIYSASTDAALTALPDTIHGGKTNSVGNVLTYTYKNVAPGTYYYAVTTWYCAPGQTGTACSESRQSAHVSTTVAPPQRVPGPPANTKITVTVSAP